MSDKDVTQMRPQNLPSIKYISALRTGSIEAVLDAMKRCETLSLTSEEMAMAADISQSIIEHRPWLANLASTYLIRYGMLLERERGGHKDEL